MTLVGRTHGLGVAHVLNSQVNLTVLSRTHPTAGAKKPALGGLSVAQIAPFSVPVKYLRSYVNQVQAVCWWLDLCLRLGENGCFSPYE